MKSITLKKKLVIKEMETSKIQWNGAIDTLKKKLVIKEMETSKIQWNGAIEQ
jgi:hypothetical protein